MAHKRQRDQAYKLYKKGFYPADIAAQLRVPLRTAQRWVKKFNEENGAKIEEQEKQESATGQLLEQSFNLIALTPQKQNLPKLEFQNQDWFESTSNLAKELLTIHSNIRQKLVQLLEVKLEDSDLNLRLIQGLSQSICRHSEREESIASLSLLELNKAYTLIEKHGYAVVDPNSYSENQ